MKFPENVSESTKRRNPGLYGLPVAGLPNPERKPNQRRKGQDPELDKSKTGMGYRISIISFRKKLVDEHDNLRMGCKPLVDAITRSLGFSSDDNPRLHWEYQQCKTEGRLGTLVKIEAI